MLSSWCFPKIWGFLMAFSVNFGVVGLWTYKLAEFIVGVRFYRCRKMCQVSCLRIPRTFDTVVWRVSGLSWYDWIFLLLVWGKNSYGFLYCGLSFVKSFEHAKKDLWNALVLYGNSIMPLLSYIKICTWCQIMWTCKAIIKSSVSILHS